MSIPMNSKDGYDLNDMSGRKPSRRPFVKQVMQWMRRGHLYLGLFLFPWAILYGVTGFLFNHPSAFADRPTVRFGQSHLQGTPLVELPTCDEIANTVVRRLNEHHQPEHPFELQGEAKYAGRGFAFATVTVAEGDPISLLFEVTTGSGTIRSNPPTPKPKPVPPPFAMGGKGPSNARISPNAPQAAQASQDVKLIYPEPLQSRITASIPTLLERTGFIRSPAEITDIKVTSVPDLEIPIVAEGRLWLASYNSLTGVVQGKPADDLPATELSWRRFLLRLHMAHGYPGETNSKWFWAVVVDLMAFTLCFWGLSGLLMWWQIKATRRLGLIILATSATIATALGVGMHAMLTAT